MYLYSYKGQEPTTLPSRIRLDDGSTRTSLNELNSEELENIGFVGPISKPEFDEDTQKIVWNGSLYEIISLTEEEILQKVSDKELKDVNYNLFWEKFFSSKVYRKIRTEASKSLAVNTIFTELIALFGDAKLGNPNTGMLNQYMNIIFFIFNFTEEELEELNDLIIESNLNSVYSIPSEEYLSSHVYDEETNTILPPAPFKSWIIVNGQWEPPVPYPFDGKIYDWKEESMSWVEI